MMPPTTAPPKAGQQRTWWRHTPVRRVLAEVGPEGRLGTPRHAFASDAPGPVVKRWVGPRVIGRYTHLVDEASMAAVQRRSAAHAHWQGRKESQDLPDKG